jgi:hypothetical protein
MSALGQKQTYAVQQVMSALPPIATAKANSRKRSCLLSPQKRTFAVRWSMSAKGYKRTSGRLRAFREYRGNARQGHSDFGELARPRIDLD